jgi:hypothetical protein
MAGAVSSSQVKWSAAPMADTIRAATQIANNVV